MKRALAMVAGPLFVFAVFALAAPREAQAQGGSSFSVVIGSPGVYGYPSPYYSYYPPVVVRSSYYSCQPNYPVYSSYYNGPYRIYPRPLYGLPYGYRGARVYPY